MAPLLLSFGVSFVYIFIKAFQQLNVVHRNYAWIPVASVMMGFCEAYIVVAQVQNGLHWPVILSLGLGAGSGACVATFIHHRYVEKHA